VQEQQPKGLRYLILAQIWERLGYYSLQTILILFLTKALLLSEKNAYLIHGTFTSMLFLAAMIGSYYAERYLGFFRAVMVGGAFLLLGYLMLAWSSLTWMGLSLVIVGNGLFTPSLLHSIKELFKPDDQRCVRAFSFLSMGMCIGAMIPPLFLGWIIKVYGWEAGFLSAALAVFISLVIVFSRRHFYRRLSSIPLAKVMNIRLLAGLVTSCGVFYFLFQFPRETNWLISCVIFPALLGWVFFLLKKSRGLQVNTVGSLLLLLVSIGYWTVQSQTWTSLILYADKNISKHWMGITLDAEWTRFFYPLFLFFLIPLFIRIGGVVEKKGLSFMMKGLSLSVLCLSFGFYVLGMGGVFFSDHGEVSAWWLIASYFIQALGELCLIPIALSFFSGVLPQHVRGMMLTAWFIARAVAFSLGAELATLTAVPLDATLIESLQVYNSAFILYGTIALGLSIASFVFLPTYKRFKEWDVSQSS